MKLLETVIRKLIRLRWLIIIFLSSLMVVSAITTLKSLDIDNSLSIWFLEDDPSYRAYIDYQEKFGSDEIFVGMIPVENALDAQHIKTLNALHKDINALWFVNTSFSLANAKYPIYTNKKVIFDDLYNPARSEKGLNNLLKKLPNISSQLITEDSKNLFFYIQLKPTPQIENQRESIFTGIKSTIDKHFDDYLLTGAPVLNEAYSRGVYRESLVFGALTIVVITLMLVLLLPSKYYLPMAMCSVAVPLIILFGIMSTFGFELNMISMLIPTILMVYSVSDAVHIINIYHKETQSHPEKDEIKRITQAIKHSFTPCFYTTLTTFVGYFALYLSPLPAFKNMGLATSMGLILAFVLVYVITIIGFSFITINLKNAQPILKLNASKSLGLVNWLNTFTTRYKNATIAVFTVVLCFGIYSVFNVKIDTNSLDLLAEGKAKKELREVEANLGSSSRLQINITSKNDMFIKPTAIKQLEKFQKAVASSELAKSPVSIVNIKQFLEQRHPVLFQSNISASGLKSTMKDLSEDSQNFYKMFSSDFKTAGMTIGVKELKTSELEELLEHIETNFQQHFDTEQFELKINGFSVVFAQLNNFILETQLKSFLAAFVVAFLCLWLFIKRLKTTLLVLIPNVLPLAILAAVMSLLDIPLDVSTAMITPIMLGIAMDDTIHLVYKYKRNASQTGPPETRINYAISYTGTALFATTIALVAGFLIISSSAIPSVSDFGILCAVTVAIALITDVFYLPALLKKYDS